MVTAKTIPDREHQYVYRSFLHLWPKPGGFGTDGWAHGKLPQVWPDADGRVVATDRRALGNRRITNAVDRGYWSRRGGRGRCDCPDRIPRTWLTVSADGVAIARVRLTSSQSTKRSGCARPCHLHRSCCTGSAGGCGKFSRDGVTAGPARRANPVLGKY